MKRTPSYSNDSLEVDLNFEIYPDYGNTEKYPSIDPQTITLKQRILGVDEIVLYNDASGDAIVDRVVEVCAEYLKSINANNVKFEKLVYDTKKDRELRMRYLSDDSSNILFKNTIGRNILSIYFTVAYTPNNDFARYVRIYALDGYPNFWESKGEVLSGSLKSSTKYMKKILSKFLGNNLEFKEEFSYAPFRILSNWKKPNFKKYLNGNKYPYEGIYEHEHDIIAIKKLDDEFNYDYALVNLYSLSQSLFRQEGTIFGFLKKTSIPTLFKAEIFELNGDASSIDITLDETSLIIPTKDKESTIFLRTYPIKDNETINKDEDIWTGTGFALKNGYIVTNYHVVDGANDIVIVGVKGESTEYKAKVVGSDKNADLAILRIDDSNFKGFSPIPYAIRKNTCDVGENIFVLGYPLTTYMGEEIKLTNGIINSRTGYQGDVSTYQISAPIQPGNSGGPMFDSKGNIVGIVNAGMPDAENVGYAIKTTYLFNLLNALSLDNVIPQSNTVAGKSLPEINRAVNKHVLFIKCKK